MARFRPILTELFQQAMGGWRRESWRGPNRAAFFRYLGFTAAAPEAEARGLRLLRENLSPAQREQQERYGYFDVLGGKTGRRYRIKNGFQLNVELLDNKGRTTTVLCFMPEGNLVAGDVMLAQKLAIELFKSDTLKIANKFSIGHRCLMT